MKLSCTGCKVPAAPIPSMVVSFLPSAATAKVRHEVIGAPSMSTVQAPQSPVEQPSFVPVSPAA